MRVEQLEYLLAIANNGSISAVAKRLYISQTTLSTMVQSVEQELGKEIFRRTARGVVATPYGEKALPIMQKMVDDYYTLKSMDSKDAARVQDIHICSYPCACNFWSLKITGILKERGIDARLTVHEAPEDKIMARVLDGTASIGFGVTDKNSLSEQQRMAQKNGLILEFLFEDSPAVYVNPDSPFVGRDEVTLQELSEEHLAMTDCCLGRFYNSNMAKFVTHISVFPNIETAKNSIRMHNMISCMPNIAMGETETSGGLVRIPVTGNDDNLFANYLLHPKSEQLSTSEQVILDGIRACFCEN